MNAFTNGDDAGTTRPITAPAREAMPQNPNSPVKQLRRSFARLRLMARSWPRLKNNLHMSEHNNDQHP